MIMFFFFKQKTAYEMRISDWSSDVCSSDLVARVFEHQSIPPGQDRRRCTHDLPEWIVPWHDRQNEAKRIIDNTAIGGRTFDKLVAEEAGRRVCVELEITGDILDFTDSFWIRLSLLKGYTTGKSFLVP